MADFGSQSGWQYGFECGHAGLDARKNVHEPCASIVTGSDKVSDFVGVSAGRHFVVKDVDVAVDVKLKLGKGLGWCQPERPTPPNTR